VVGIVASRVVEKYHRPAFVLGIENGVAQGSGRSIRAFHLLESLESMGELFTKFGGHRQAAGVTLDAARLEEFRRRFRAHAAALLTPADFEPTLEIDSEISFAEINDQTVDEILRLAPFGFGNPAPLFVARDVEPAAPVDVRNEKHIFTWLKSGNRKFRVKAWNFADRAGEISGRMDVALQFEDDAYSAGRGYAPWQTILRDVRAAGSRERTASSVS
jgi:single-stranded-DNA-specific exonuclease